MLPLALIVIVLYTSMFFAHGDQTGDRISMAVTALLLQVAIYSGLPDIGYTVAIEYGFYAFYILTLVCTLIALWEYRLAQRDHDEAVRRPDLFACSFCPIFVLGVVLVYSVRYGFA